MRTSAKCVALLLLLAVGLAGPAWAHGGQYRGPGDRVPPGLKEPSDPTPPSPPPPTGSPVTPPTGTPDTGRPATDPVTGEPVPAPVTGDTPTPDLGGDRGKGAAASLNYENWVFWYHHNKADIENLKKALYTRVNTDNELFRIGGGNLANRSDALHEITDKVRSKIIPTFLSIIDAKKMHQDTRSAAFIGLAKMANDMQQVEVIQTGLDLARKPDVIVQESAAIGLGLLRRERASERFEGADLDKVRAFLFDVFENEDYGARTRGLAILAIGLLGDQPTAGTGGANQTTARLFELLKQRDAFPRDDLTYGLLIAIGMQPAASVVEDQRGELRSCLLRGTLYKQPAASMTRAYAAQTLGRIGNKNDIAVLRRGMTIRRNKNRDIQRSCAIGLGQLARHVTGDARIELTNVLLEQIDKSKDASTRNFAIISLSDVLRADIRANRTDVIGDTKIKKRLMDLAEDYRAGPFAALSLALIGKEIGDHTVIDAYGDMRSESIDVLKKGLTARKMNPRDRGAYAVGLGIMRDGTSVKTLVEIVSTRKSGDELRGYSALALGLIGVATPNVVDPLHAALKERRSEEMRQNIASALGLLRDREAVPLLLEELGRARSQNEKGQIVLALARIGDARAVDPLITRLNNEKEQDLTRALACAGLGVIGDLEWLPSFSRISLDVNYRASNDLLNEVLSLI